MKPYYTSERVTIYHADCRDLLTSDEIKADLLLTDPPYGIGADRNLRANKRHGKAATASRDYGPGEWDAEPVDSAILTALKLSTKEAIIWGGNYFTLPPSACWLVWDKDNGSNGYADCELAWTNLQGAVRRLRYRWMGMLQEHSGARKEERFHPTQKPVELMRWCLRLTSATSVLDPFMGSGTTLLAACDLGLRAVGVEREERYCEAAATRLDVAFRAPNKFMPGRSGADMYREAL